MEKKATKMGRPKTVMEPAMYVDVTKTCPFCSSIEVEFKFLNNKSTEQPRYKCLGCTKFFTHNPNSGRKKHPEGYSKIAGKRKSGGSGGRLLSSNRNFDQDNTKMQAKFSSRRRGEEEDSNDEDSEIDEDEMAKMDVLHHMNVEKNQDSASDSDEDEEEEPSEFVEIVKPCNWCRSRNTEFCKTLKDSGLLEYQCQACCAHLKFDGATRRVLPIERQSRTTKYNLRCTKSLAEA